MMKAHCLQITFIGAWKEPFTFIPTTTTRLYKINEVLWKAILILIHWIGSKDSIHLCDLCNSRQVVLCMYQSLLSQIITHMRSKSIKQADALSPSSEKCSCVIYCFEEIFHRLFFGISLFFFSFSVHGFRTIQVVSWTIAHVSNHNTCGCLYGMPWRMWK